MQCDVLISYLVSDGDRRRRRRRGNDRAEYVQWVFCSLTRVRSGVRAGHIPKSVPLSTGSPRVTRLPTLSLYFDLKCEPVYLQ